MRSPGGGKRNHLETHRLPSRIRLDLQPVFAHRVSSLARVVHRRAQSVEQPFFRHLQQIQAGFAGRWFDVLETWRGWADDVSGRAVDCGHFLAEEAPDEVYAELRGFFAA